MAGGNITNPVAWLFHIVGTVVILVTFVSVAVIYDMITGGMSPALAGTVMAAVLVTVHLQARKLGVNF